MTIAADRNLTAHVPAEWSVVPLKEVLLTSQYGLNSSSGNGGAVPIVGMKDIQGGRVDVTSLASIDIDRKTLDAYRLRPGDILLNRTNSPDLVGKIGIFTGDALAVFASYLVRLQANSKIINPHFLNAWLNADPVQSIINRVATRAISQANINPTRFLEECFVPVPPLPEQRRIATILGTWDAAVEKAERALAAKTYRRGHWHTALVLQFEGSTKPLHELITPVQRPIPRPNKPYTAVGIRSHGKGTFHRHVSRPEQIDMDTLFVVTARDLIVNITFAWEGAIALAKPRDEGCLVSHRFPTFQINEDVVNRDYLGFAVNNARFFYALRGISPGSAGRNRVLNQKDFLRLSIPFPPKRQQDRIAYLLTAADRDIAATADLIARLKTQKRGLMQELLTGKTRVSEAIADLSPAAD